MKVAYKKPSLAWFHARKPYQNANLNYDAQYFKVLEEIVDTIYKNVGNFIGIEQQYELAYMLTGYLEDFLCDIGMWQAIREGNKKLYGTSVPIFLNKTKSPLDYSEDDINIEDICLIIWYNLSKKSNEIHNAENANIWQLASKILAIMNKHYEKLPATAFYDDFFTIKQGDDWGELKGKLNWFAFNSPFVQLEANQKLQELSEGSNQKRDAFSQITPIMNHESVLFRTGTGWHGQIINEMFADVCRCDAFTKKQLYELARKDMAIYYLKNKDKTHFNFYNTYTNEQYLVPLGSIVQPTPSGQYYFAGFVKWGNNWEFNGVLFGGWTDHEIPDELNEKFQNNFYYYVPEYQNQINELLKGQHGAFMATFGSEIAISNNEGHFLENLKKYDEKYYDLIVKDKSISKKEYVLKYGMASRAHDLFPANANLSMFYNKKAGMEYVYELFWLKNLLNKKYEDLTKPQILEILGLIMEDSISANFVLAFGEITSFQNLYKIFKIETAAEFQFILRFYKPDDFRFRVPLQSISNLCNGRWQASKFV